MRPMFWEYPEDEVCYTLEDQYFYGKDILVAPVYEQGCRERKVYLPEGKWIRMRDGHSAASESAVSEGAGWITCEAEWNEFIVFVKAGSDVVQCFR